MRHTSQRAALRIPLSRRPPTLDDHQTSRWIVAPLRLYDCCQETDGGCAVVVTTPERAGDLKRPAAVIRGVGQGASRDQESMTSFSRPDIARLPEMDVVAARCYRQSGLGPGDIDAAVIYDAFTSIVLWQLESFGVCTLGEAKDFVNDGSLEVGGRLPTNTHGGQPSEAYIHGVNGVVEGVRLVRGTSVNQPTTTVEHVLVTGASACRRAA